MRFHGSISKVSYASHTDKSKCTQTHGIIVSSDTHPCTVKLLALNGTVSSSSANGSSASCVWIE